MALSHQRAAAASSLSGPLPRHAYLDNLKVSLVMGVIVAHATMAWTGLGTWVFDEPHVREPLLSILTLVAVIGSLFGMAVFFFIAGSLTPTSLARKGFRRFLTDRGLRLGVPLVFFVLALSPVVEYVDPDNAHWSRGFAAFAVHDWWPPAPGPTWFLGVLLAFSVAYAVIRAVVPWTRAGRSVPSARNLGIACVIIGLASYLVRIAVPLGEERWHLALGQAPAWVAGFTLGVLAAERGWLNPIDPQLARWARLLAWWAAAGCAVVVSTAAALGADIDDFGGGGTWQSLLTAGIEGALVVSMSFWLVDVFRRRFDRQGRLARELSRAAFAAFVVHQVVLVGLVLASRQVPWPPEVEYLLVAALGVIGSFGLGALVVRLPGLSRIL